MHCLDSDYLVFSILPPYNTVEAQLIVNGRFVTDGTGYQQTSMLPAPAWTPDAHAVVTEPESIHVDVSKPSGDGFLRLRRVQ